MIQQHPDIDPAVLLSKAAEEISPKVSHPLMHQLADVLTGEILGEVLHYLRLHHLGHGLQQFLIGTHPLQLLFIVRSLDHLIGLLADIDPVQRIIGIA